MKRYKALEEVHEIMERIHEEEKGLTSEQRAERVREEAEKYLSERQLDLKRPASCPRLVHTSGHGMEPKILWSAIRRKGS